MKSSPATAFSPEDIAELGPMSPDHPSAPWYLAGRRLRAKRIARSDIQSESTPNGSGMSTTVGAIAPKLSSPIAVAQRLANVQLSATESELLETIDATCGVVSAQTLATELGCSAQSLRRGDLHRLLVKGLIVAVHGRGYRRAE